MTNALRAKEAVRVWPARPTGAPTHLALGAIELMGAGRLFKQAPQSRAEIHGALVKGLPYALLVTLVDQLTALSAEQVADAVGISARTLRRRQKDHTGKPMPADLASKTWQFAEILAQASAGCGSRDAAERWMARPAMGLDGALPVELLRTLQGSELVTEFLGRLEHGVYT